MRDSTEIQILARSNPHRYGSLDSRRFGLLRSGMTVGQFVAIHNQAGPLEVGGLGSTWHAKRYLKYMMQRGLLLLPGVTVERRVAPPVAPLATSLNDFTFGVEIECFLPRGMSHSAIADRITAAGVECRAEMYGHSRRTWWKVVTDGSLNDYSYGVEFVSPVLQGQAGLEQVDKVCRELKSAGCKVTRRCGLHVHVGAENRSPNFFRRLLTLYARNEAAIDSVLAPSRRGSANDFCQPIRIDQVALDRANTLQQISRAVYQNTETRDYTRYRKLSLQSYWQHRTVEFRQHQGTVEADKTCNWIKFCLRMALVAEGSAELIERATLADLLTLIGASDEERAYFNRRAERLAQQQLNRRAA